MKHDHYFPPVGHLQKVDAYRILDLFGVTCPVAQHVVKKAVAAGQRGHKSTRRDWQDIADSAARKLEMIDEDAGVIAGATLPGEAVKGVELYTGRGGVLIQCPGCLPASCECRP